MSRNSKMLEAIIREALEEGLSDEAIDRQEKASNEEARRAIDQFEKELVKNDVGEKAFMILVMNDSARDHAEVMHDDLRDDTKEALKQMGFKQEEVDNKTALYHEETIIIPFINELLFDFALGNAYHLLSYFPETPTEDDILRCHQYAWHVMEKSIKTFKEYYNKLEELLM